MLVLFSIAQAWQDTLRVVAASVEVLHMRERAGLAKLVSSLGWEPAEDADAVIASHPEDVESLRVAVANLSSAEVRACESLCFCRLFCRG